MGSKNDKLIKAKAKEFDKLRKKILPSNAKCELLLIIGTSGTYRTLYTLRHWWPQYNREREQLGIREATQDVGFINSLQESSHLRYNGVIYEISTRDVRPADGRRPYWTIYCILNADKFA